MTWTAHSFWEEARYQRACAVCGRAGGCPDARGRVWHAHHVIDRQWLKRNRRDQFDPRNALRLCTDCHGAHEYAGPGKVDIELKMLTDDNIAFAFEVMGIGAGVYLRRHYTGHDRRVCVRESHLEKPGLLD